MPVMVMLLSDLCECSARLEARPTRVIRWLVDVDGARLWGAELSPRHRRRRFTRWEQMQPTAITLAVSGLAEGGARLCPFPWGAPVLGARSQCLGTLVDAEVTDSGRLVYVHVSSGLLRDIRQGRRRLPVHWLEGRGLLAPLRLVRDAVEGTSP